MIIIIENARAISLINAHNIPIINIITADIINTNTITSAAVIPNRIGLCFYYFSILHSLLFLRRFVHKRNKHINN